MRMKAFQEEFLCELKHFSRGEGQRHEEVLFNHYTDIKPNFGFSCKHYFSYSVVLGDQT